MACILFCARPISSSLRNILRGWNLWSIPFLIAYDILYRGCITSWFFVWLWANLGICLSCAWTWSDRQVHVLRNSSSVATVVLVLWHSTHQTTAVQTYIRHSTSRSSMVVYKPFSFLRSQGFLLSRMREHGTTILLMTRVVQFIRYFFSFSCVIRPFCTFFWTETWKNTLSKFNQPNKKSTNGEQTRVLELQC